MKVTPPPAPTIHLGDCIEVMRSLPESSVDSIVTDPPYGLGFMGKAWDDLPPGEEWARECLRVLRPGGHLLAFGGSRTWHRLAVAVEDAGFEVRDSIAWLYGSGFPKSLDVSKGIDRLRTEDREPMLRVRAWLNSQRIERGFSLGQINALFGLATNGGGNASNWTQHPTNIEIPSWEKWLTLKDALGLPDEMDAEVWRLNGRKGTPGDAWQNAEVVGIREGAMSGWNMDGTTRFVDREEKAPATPAAAQWQGWGTALKPAFEPVVVARKPLTGTVAQNVLTHGTGALNIDGCRVGNGGDRVGGGPRVSADGWGWSATGERPTGGRWPANVVLDESQAAALDQQSGITRDGVAVRRRGVKAGMYGPDLAPGSNDMGYGGSGGASRFFYVAKAPTRERPKVDGIAHPTVKPLTLMRWLVRLVTPPGGTVLEPFAGSGTTVEACALEGFACIAIEREPDYLPLIQARLARVQAPTKAAEALNLFDIEETA